MSREVSLFSGYSIRENRVTNYCLLMLRMIYEENPKFLGLVLSGLIDPEMANRVGVYFRQQSQRGASTPDGVILQSGIAIYIETKNWDWFYDDQLDRHLDAISKEHGETKILLALGNFEEDEEDRFKPLRERVKAKYSDSVVFEAVTFESLVKALGELPLPKNLQDAVQQFKEFLDEESLLPTWKHWIDVVSCGKIPEDVLEWNVYMCPATGGAYSHSRCKYFGMYRNKCIEKVALIEAVVDVDLQGDDHLKWKQGDESVEALKARARQIVTERRPGDGPTRVLLLGQLFDTELRKQSPGGIRNKQYFDVSRFLKRDSAAELAEEMARTDWETFIAG